MLEPDPKTSTAVDSFKDGHVTTSHPVNDEGLMDVLGAIRVAPKDGKGGHRKKKRVR